MATDHVTYTLLVLCWNQGQCSPIHDHPCDGCWMRVLEGQVQECRYQPQKGGTAGSDDAAAAALVGTSDETYTAGDLAFIDDNLGYHKVGNPSATVPAVTLHLYSPPFATCKVWTTPDQGRSSEPPRNSGAICHYTEYGRRV